MIVYALAQLYVRIAYLKCDRQHLINNAVLCTTWKEDDFHQISHQFHRQQTTVLFLCWKTTVGWHEESGEPIELDWLIQPRVNFQRTYSQERIKRSRF